MNKPVEVETLGLISPNDAATLATTATFDTGRIQAIVDHEATDLIAAPVSGFPFFEAAVGVGDCEKTWAEHTFPVSGSSTRVHVPVWVTAARFV